MKLRKELWFGFSLMAAIIIPVIVLMPWGHLTNGHLGLMMLALICVGIMLGFPTAFTLMGMGVFFAWLAYRSVDPATADRRVLDLFVQRTYGIMSNDVLIAVPLFLFMGYLVVLAKWKPSLMPPLAESERRVELPAFARTLAPRGTNALVALWGAVVGGGAGVPRRTVLAQFFVTLVPALFIAAVLGITYRIATAPEVEASTAGLIEAGGLVAAPEPEREASTGLIGAPEQE